jgi:hypothetical protein
MNAPAEALIIHLPRRRIKVRAELMRYHFTLAATRRKHENGFRSNP